MTGETITDPGELARPARRRARQRDRRRGRRGGARRVRPGGPAVRLVRGRSPARSASWSRAGPGRWSDATRDAVREAARAISRELGASTWPAAGLTGTVTARPPTIKCPVNRPKQSVAYPWGCPMSDNRFSPRRRAGGDDRFGYFGAPAQQPAPGGAGQFGGGPPPRPAAPRTRSAPAGPARPAAPFGTQAPFGTPTRLPAPARPRRRPGQAKPSPSPWSPSPSSRPSAVGLPRLPALPARSAAGQPRRAARSPASRRSRPPSTTRRSSCSRRTPACRCSSRRTGSTTPGS